MHFFVTTVTSFFIGRFSPCCTPHCFVLPFSFQPFLFICFFVVWGTRHTCRFCGKTRHGTTCALPLFRSIHENSITKRSLNCGRRKTTRERKKSFFCEVCGKGGGGIKHYEKTSTSISQASLPFWFSPQDSVVLPAPYPSVPFWCRPHEAPALFFSL